MTETQHSLAQRRAGQLVQPGVADHLPVDRLCTCEGGSDERVGKVAPELLEQLSRA